MKWIIAMKKTKITTLFISLVLGMGLLLTACGGNAKVPSSSNDEDAISVVTTIFPEYDWAKQISEGSSADIDLALLLDNGVDLHSYQPTADDVIKITTCDLFIYVGGESDEWVDDALENAVNKDMIVLDLIDILGEKAKAEEVVEGMEEEEDEDEHEEAEADEHVWLSLRNASLFCEEIAEAFKQLDPDNAATYDSNLASYKEQLAALDEEYKQVAENAEYKTLLFGDRFPFRYLVDDYGLDYYAAFPGCSAETEASFETVMKLSQKVDELSLPVVMKTENSDGKIADTIVDNTKDKNQKTMALNSMQSITSEDAKKGVTYLGIMEENLETLKSALNRG